MCLHDMKTRKYSNRVESYSQVSGETGFEHVVYSAAAVVCTDKEASSGSVPSIIPSVFSNDLSQI